MHDNVGFIFPFHCYGIYCFSEQPRHGICNNIVLTLNVNYLRIEVQDVTDLSNKHSVWFLDVPQPLTRTIVRVDIQLPTTQQMS